VGWTILKKWHVVCVQDSAGLEAVENRKLISLGINHFAKYLDTIYKNMCSTLI
jgi:hypothetical protein